MSLGSVWCGAPASDGAPVDGGVCNGRVGDGGVGDGSTCNDVGRSGVVECSDVSMCDRADNSDDILSRVNVARSTAFGRSCAGDGDGDVNDRTKADVSAYSSSFNHWLTQPKLDDKGWCSCVCPLKSGDVEATAIGDGSASDCPNSVSARGSKLVDSGTCPCVFQV